MNGERTEHEVGGLTVRIHRGACMAHGDCIEVAPGVFTLAEDGLVTVRADAADPGRERLAVACAVCPEAALELIGPDGMPIRPSR